MAFGAMPSGTRREKENFGDVATNGSLWMEIRWEIAAEFPQVANIVQSALNTEQQVGDG